MIGCVGTTGGTDARPPSTGITICGMGTTSPRPRARRVGLLTALSLGAGGAVLLGLFAVADVSVAEDGTLVEPFGLLALGMLALTAAGLTGLVLAFRAVRRRSACARGAC